MKDLVAEGLLALQNGHYFQAHELLEQRWLVCRGDERRLLQALIQFAAACLHLEHRRPAPARVVLARAAAKLEGLELVAHGISAPELARAISEMQAILNSGENPLPLTFNFFNQAP